MWLLWIFVGLFSKLLVSHSLTLPIQANFTICGIGNICPTTAPNCVNNVCVNLACSDLTVLHEATNSPATIIVLFQASDCLGNPITGLSINNFVLTENALPLAPYESSATLVSQPSTYSTYTLLLLDMSGSVVVYISQLISAVTTFITTSSSSTNFIGIYGFGGNATNPVFPIVGFTNTSTALIAQIQSLGNFIPYDRATNLYGAIINAEAELIRVVETSTAAFKGGTLVVFTDGSDDANVWPLTSAQAAIQSAWTSQRIITMAVAVGAALNFNNLDSIFGLYMWESDPSSFTNAFSIIATRVSALANNNYYLTYCSPSRAGTSTLSVQLVVAGVNFTSASITDISYSFSAVGFTGSCTSATLLNPCQGACGNINGLYCGPCSITISSSYNGVIPPYGVLSFIYTPSTADSFTIYVTPPTGAVTTTPPFFRLTMSATQIPSIYYFDATADADSTNSIIFTVSSPIARLNYNFALIQCSSLTTCQTNSVAVPAVISVTQINPTLRTTIIPTSSGVTIPTPNNIDSPTTVGSNPITTTFPPSTAKTAGIVIGALVGVVIGGVILFVGGKAAYKYYDEHYCDC